MGHMPSIKILLSIIRTLIYCGVAGILTVKHGKKPDMLDAALIGGILSDNLTWLIKSLALRPSNIRHGGYDSFVNIVFGWYMLDTVLPKSNLQDQNMGIAFLAFLLVLGVKATFYVVRVMKGGEEDTQEDDEDGDGQS